MGKSKLMTMPPRVAAIWLAPGIIAVVVIFGLQMISASPVLSFGVASVGLLPSVVVVAWGTIKFRSYYEVQRTRHDYMTMVNATLIQVLALGICAYLFIQALDAYDLLMNSH